MKRIVAAIIILLLMLGSGAAINQFKQNSPTLSAATMMPLTNDDSAAIIEQPAAVAILVPQTAALIKNSHGTTADNKIIENTEVAKSKKMTKAININMPITQQSKTKAIVSAVVKPTKSAMTNISQNTNYAGQLNDRAVDSNAASDVENVLVTKVAPKSLHTEQPLAVKQNSLNLNPSMPPGTLGGGNGNGGPGAGQQSVSSN